LGAEHLRDVLAGTCIVGLASVPVAVIRGRSVRPRKGAFTGNVVEANPEVVSHNMETVRRLTREVRIQAKYDRSLELLFRLKKGGMRTKSGVMLGLGDTPEEVIETMQDLRSVNVDILTLGQYLQPTPKHLPVAEFIEPAQFDHYKKIGLEMGFRYVESGPLVRSSYHAEKHLFD
jgi:lipoic acid synthetase